MGDRWPVLEHGAGVRLSYPGDYCRCQGCCTGAVHLHCKFWGYLAAAALGGFCRTILSAPDKLTVLIALSGRNKPDQDAPESQCTIHLLKLAFQLP